MIDAQFLALARRFPAVRKELDALVALAQKLRPAHTAWTFASRDGEPSKLVRDNWTRAKFQFDAALLAFRNICRKNGISPPQKIGFTDVANLTAAHR